MVTIASILILIYSLYTLKDFRKNATWSGGGFMPPAYLAIIMLVAATLLLINELRRLL